MSTQTGKCSACQKFGSVELHHLLARADHGNTNLTVPLCGHCHGLAHAVKARPNNLGELIRRGKLKAARLRAIAAYHEITANNVETVLLNLLSAMDDAFTEDIAPTLDKIDRAYVWLLNSHNIDSVAPDELKSMVSAIKETMNAGSSDGADVEQSRQDLAVAQETYAISRTAAFVKATD